MVLGDLGAPVQRLDQCGHRPRVLHLVEQVQNAKTVHAVLREGQVSLRQWTDDDVGDFAYGHAVAITAVRGQRLRVNLFEIEDRVFAANRIG